MWMKYNEEKKEHKHWWRVSHTITAKSRNAGIDIAAPPSRFRRINYFTGTHLHPLFPANFCARSMTIGSLPRTIAACRLNFFLTLSVGKPLISSGYRSVYFIERCPALAIDRSIDRSSRTVAHIKRITRQRRKVNKLSCRTSSRNLRQSPFCSILPGTRLVYLVARGQG